MEPQRRRPRPGHRHGHGRHGLDGLGGPGLRLGGGDRRSELGDERRRLWPVRGDDGQGSVRRRRRLHPGAEAGGGRRRLGRVQGREPGQSQKVQGRFRQPGGNDRRRRGAARHRQGPARGVGLGHREGAAQRFRQGRRHRLRHGELAARSRLGRRHDGPAAGRRRARAGRRHREFSERRRRWRGLPPAGRGHADSRSGGVGRG